MTEQCVFVFQPQAIAQHTLSQSAQEHWESNGAAGGVCVDVDTDKAHNDRCALHAVCDGKLSVGAADHRIGYQSNPKVTLTFLSMRINNL